MEKINIHLLRYLVKHARLDFDDVSSFKDNQEFNLRPNFRRFFKKINDDTIQVNLSVQIDRQYSPFDLYVEIEGVFQLKKWEENEEKRFIATNNTTAILFPYLRQTVTTLTSMSGLNPVVLPIINTTNLFNEFKPSSQK